MSDFNNIATFRLADASKIDNLPANTNSELALKAAASHTHDDIYYTETETNFLLNGKQSVSEKGQPSGYASLDGTGKVPASQLPATVVDGDMSKSTYDTNDNGIVDNSEKLGGQLPSYYLDVDNHTDGTTNKVYTTTEKTKLAGIEAGAEVNTINSVVAGTNIFIDNTDPLNPIINASGGEGGGAVDSVNGQTGVVVLDTDDIAEGTTNKYLSATDKADLTDGGDTELHTHDGRYYTETETNNLLNAKANDNEVVKITGTQTIQDFNNKALNGNTLKIVCIGDSMTFGLEQGTASTQVSIPYPLELQNKLRTFYKNNNITVINKGVSGRYVADLVSNYTSDVVNEVPDLVIQMIGINDSNNSTTIDDFYNSIKSLAENAKDNNFPTIFVTSTPIRRESIQATKNNYRLSYYREVVKDVANLFTIPVIDMEQEFNYLINGGGYSIWDFVNHSTDELHPDQNGYILVADIIAKNIITCTSIIEKGEFHIPLVSSLNTYSSNIGTSDIYKVAGNEYITNYILRKNTPGKYVMCPIYVGVKGLSLYANSCKNTNGTTAGVRNNGTTGVYSINFYNSSLVANIKDLLDNDLSIGLHILEFNSDDFAGGDLSTAQWYPTAFEIKDNTYIDLITTQTISGVKTFNSSPIVPTPTADMEVATKKYVDDNAGGGGASFNGINGQSFSFPGEIVPGKIAELTAFNSGTFNEMQISTLTRTTGTTTVTVKKNGTTIGTATITSSTTATNGRYYGTSTDLADSFVANDVITFEWSDTGNPAGTGIILNLK